MSVSLPSLLDGSLWWIWALAIFLGVVLIYALAGLYLALCADKFSIERASDE